MAKNSFKIQNVQLKLLIDTKISLGKHIFKQITNPLFFGIIPRHPHSILFHPLGYPAMFFRKTARNKFDR